MNKKGFTVIELIIITTVIASLAAIAIPRFTVLIDCARVNDKRHSQGLPLLTVDQFNKMYPNPPVGEDASNLDSKDNLEVVCSATRVGKDLFINVSSCHEKN